MAKKKYRVIALISDLQYCPLVAHFSKNEKLTEPPKTMEIQLYYDLLILTDILSTTNK